MAAGTWKVTWKGLRRAASNVFWFPFRVLLTAFVWFIRLGLFVALVLAVFTTSLGAYYYFVKSNQPMVIDPRYAVSQPPEGMTFRELWQDRFAGWAKLDEQDYRTGKSKSKDTCRFVNLVVFPPAHIFVPFQRIAIVRLMPDSPLAKQVIRESDGMIAPSDLNFVDALWWQIENETWWYWVDHLIRPCQLPPPKRPAAP